MKKALFFLFIVLFFPVLISAQHVTEPPRAMWIWDVTIVASRHLTDELITFCRKKNINRLYLSAYNFNKVSSKNYRQFNHNAHKNGIYVHALAGDPRWGLERYHQQSLRWVENVLSFNRISKPAERFDGIQSDTEVYLLGKPWQVNKAQVMKEYLDLNRKIVELKKIEEADIIFGVDIPFWYDDDPSMTIEWRGVTKPPSFHILDIADTVTVMDYRNFTDGSNGSIALVKNEIEYADSVNKKVCIGQETKENLYPAYITFAGMSEDEMELIISKLVNAYINHPGFGCIVMHHYNSYRRLVEKEQ